MTRRTLKEIAEADLRRALLFGEFLDSLSRPNPFKQDNQEQPK